MPLITHNFSFQVIDRHLPLYQIALTPLQVPLRPNLVVRSTFAL